MRGGQATVIARFARSFCLKLDATLITVGDGTLPDGPLTIRLNGAGNVNLISALAIETGQLWRASSHRLRRADGLIIDLRHATTWQPDIPSTAPDRATLAAGLHHLRHLLHRRNLPEDGLIRLVLGAHAKTPTERLAAPIITNLRSQHLTQVTPGAAGALLGLGPGLTPSGDDLLAGLLITCHHLSAAHIANQLGPSLLSAGAARTTPISLAHLAAAARGYGSAPLHDLLNALVTNDRVIMEEALDATAKIGHSSGMDAIAGLVLASTAWLRAGDQRLAVA